MNRNDIILHVTNALKYFYDKDSLLIEYSLSERCMTHRIAVYLECICFYGYYIDCEYNKTHLIGYDAIKKVNNPKGNYIDIVITKRSKEKADDLACFEVKKNKPVREDARMVDREKLKILTSGEHFSYQYGFFIVLGRSFDESFVELYENGKLTIENILKHANKNIA